MYAIFLRNILCSVIAGGMIGLERQWRQKLAGMRTAVLVCLGACMFVSLSTMVTDETSPTRIAAQVVSGIGFLAGGIIIKDGLNVRGLNTAATLWCSAAVGSIIGAGFLLEGIICSFVITGVNIFVRFFSLRVNEMYEKIQVKIEPPSICHLSIDILEKDTEKFYETMWRTAADNQLSLEQVSSTKMTNKNTRIMLVVKGNVPNIEKMMDAFTDLNEVIDFHEMFVRYM